MEDEQAFVVMPARTLFEMTLGETLFLNAKLPTGKSLYRVKSSLLLAEEGRSVKYAGSAGGGGVAYFIRSGEPPSQMIDSSLRCLKPSNR